MSLIPTLPTPTTPTTIVLVDPSSSDGESSLDLLRDLGDDVQHVAVVTLLSGRHSGALRDYAHAENIDLTTAGWNYLDQVCERIARPGLAVETILATGPATATELAAVARDRRVERIVLPSSVVRAERAIVDRLAAETATAVVAAELAGV